MPSAAGNEADDVAEPGRRKLEARQPRRDRADDRDAVGLEVERPGESDRDDDDDQRRGQTRHEDAEREQGRERDGGDRDRRAADRAELADRLPELAERLRGVDREPEKLAELADDEDHGDAVDVADEHGPREVVGDPAEPEHPGDREARADEQREHAGELDRLGASRDRQRQDRHADEGRDRSLRPDDELPRRSEQHVGDRREQQGVEAVHRRDAGDLGVRHRRRDRERRHRDPGDHVAARARGRYRGSSPVTGSRRLSGGSFRASRNGDRSAYSEAGAGRVEGAGGVRSFMPPAPRLRPSGAGRPGGWCAARLCGIPSSLSPPSCRSNVYLAPAAARSVSSACSSSASSAGDAARSRRGRAG